MHASRMQASLPSDPRSAPRKSSKLKWVERERLVDVAHAHHPLDESEDDTAYELEGTLRLESKRNGKKKPKATGKHPSRAEADESAPDASEEDASIESEQFLRKERPQRGTAHGSGKGKSSRAPGRPSRVMACCPTPRAPKSLRCSKSRRRVCRRCALAVAGVLLAVQGIVMVFAPSALQLWLDGVLQGPAELSELEGDSRNFSNSNAYGHALSLEPTSPQPPPLASPAPSHPSEALLRSPSFNTPRPGHPPKPPPFSSPADFISSIGGQPMEKVYIGSNDGKPPMLDFHGAGDGRLYLNGQVFRVRGINWYGSEDVTTMPEGLAMASASSIIDFIADHGFNAIRILFNMEDWKDNIKVRQESWIVDGERNPELVDANYRDMLRTIIRHASRRQLLVLLACHRLRRSYKDDKHPANWPGAWNGLWFERNTTAAELLSEDKVSLLWSSVASTLCNEWNLFAVDLMNEPHMGFWGSVESTSYSDADWSAGAAKLGNSVLRACARLLIFVEGTAEFKTEWGESFKAARLNGLMARGPVALINMSKLVMSPHSYGPSLYGADASLWKWFPERFSAADFPHNLPAYWDEHFGFLNEMGIRAPIVVSETGGDMKCCDIPKVLQRPRADALYQETLLRYLDNKDAGFFYFCLNPGSHDTGGVLLDDWVTPDMDKLNLIIKSTRASQLVRTQAPPSPPSSPPHPPHPPHASLPSTLRSRSAECDVLSCPFEYHMCPPNERRPSQTGFCDLDADCVGDKEFCRAGTKACPKQTGCCVVAPTCACPPEYTYCRGPSKLHKGPFCDLDKDCVGDNDFCREGTEACPIQRTCCVTTPKAGFRSDE